MSLLNVVRFYICFPPKGVLVKVCSDAPLDIDETQPAEQVEHDHSGSADKQDQADGSGQGQTTRIALPCFRF